MKKNIALLMALVMIFSVFTMPVSAASDNAVNRTLTVPEDHVFTSENNAPILRIQEFRAGDFTVTDSVYTDEHFRLTLSRNAEFVFDGTDSIENAYDSGAHRSDFKYDINRISSRIVEVIVTEIDSSHTTGQRNTLEIPLFTKMTGRGDAEVTIDGMGSSVSNDTLKFAEVSDDKVSISVEDVEMINEYQSQKAASILIDEVMPGAIGATNVDNERDVHGFRLRLPRGFQWDDKTEVLFRGLNEANVTEEISSNGRDLDVRFDVTTPSAIRGLININPYISATRDARFGDVEVTMTGYGDIPSEGRLVIAEYRDYDVDVIVEDNGRKQFLAGRLGDLDEEYYSVEITLEEDVKDSFIANRLIDFDLPSWVQLMDVELNDDAKGNYSDLRLSSVGGNTFSYRVGEGQEELTFVLLFTVDADAVVDGSQDIVLKIAGSGVDEKEVVIGEAIPVVEIEVEEQLENIDSGFRNIDAPVIAISESIEGALIEGEYLEISFEHTYNSGIIFEDVIAEVVEGDLEIGSVRVRDGVVYIKIDAESTEASVIELTDVKITANRVIPMGEHYIQAQGSAVIDNVADEDLQEDIFPFAGKNHESSLFDVLERARHKHYTARTLYVQIDVDLGFEEEEELEVEIIEEDERKVVEMAIGQPFYYVNGEMVRMDVAPFIQDNRTMVPIRHVAGALGIEDNAIVWNADSRMVTIVTETGLVQLVIDSNVMTVNGQSVAMDTEAIIKDSRTFLPISRIARALGVEYTWDDNTRSVTFQ